MAHKKQYGLILPDSKSKAPSGTSKSKNVFGNDSSDDEESSVDWVKQSLKKQSHGSMQQKASMKVMKNALEQDPNCYQYDEVFDDMVKKKEEALEVKKGDRKAKYIDKLMKTAKHRELENELRKEREAQRERETEGDMYSDKEAFVTSGFKKKMEELRKMQEDQAYHDAIDDVTDVTKQKDMSGFYRQLYRDTMKSLPSSAPDVIQPEAIKQEETTPTNDLILAENIKQENESSSIKPESASLAIEGNKDKNTPNEDVQHTSRSSRPSQSDARDKTDRKRRHESPPSTGRRDSNRERSRSRDRHERRNQGRQRRSRSHSRGRTQHHERKHRSRSPPDRPRHHDRQDRRGDKDKTRRSDKEKDRHRRPSETAAEDAKVKIIPKENWYDFDVEIERDVKKSFYAKRTVGKAFEDALQKFISRKNILQIVTYK